jgi:tungstate transport system substrate-binding protein
VSGGGMAQALRQANEMQAYTLSDQATFWQLQRSLSLVELITGDPRLVNTYSVVYQLDHVLAGTLADWLLRGRGRALIGSFRIADRAAFAVWPEECPADAPTAEPCQPR